MCVNNDKYTVRICIYAHPFPCRLQILHFKHHRHGRRQPFQVEGPTVVGLIPNHRLSNFNASFPKPTASVWKCLPPQKKKVGRPYVWPQIGFESVISPMVFLKSPWKKKISNIHHPGEDNIKLWLSAFRLSAGFWRSPLATIQKHMENRHPTTQLSRELSLFNLYEKDK